MITITLGTIPYPFTRVVAWVKDLIDREIISEPIFFQSGATDVSALANYPLVTTTRVVESKKLLEQVHQSRLTISHAGQGSTCLLASQKVSFILLPRLAKHGEHIDNHQLYFAHSVKQFGVKYCLELSELEKVILEPPPQFRGQLFSNQKLSDHLIKAYPGSVSKSQAKENFKRWMSAGLLE